MDSVDPCNDLIFKILFKTGLWCVPIFESILELPYTASLPHAPKSLIKRQGKKLAHFIPILKCYYASKAMPGRSRIKTVVLSWGPILASKALFRSLSRSSEMTWSETDGNNVDRQRIRSLDWCGFRAIKHFVGDPSLHEPFNRGYIF